MRDESYKPSTPPRRGGAYSDHGEPPLLRRMRKVMRLFSVLFSLAVLAGIGGFLALLYLRSQALPVSKIAPASQLYDIQGRLIDSFPAGQNRQSVSLKAMSPWLVKATLAIEDHRFYEHPGLDPKGMARAVLADIRTLSMEQGASTITQQLARNLYLSHERTWTRKVKEAMYAVQLELQLSKDQILEEYLNQIYYGFSAYGAQAASRMYFGKDAAELDLAESALLAGIPKGPKYYSPYLDMDKAKSRQRDILDAMVKYGDISRDEADRAARERLAVLPYRPERTAEAPYFRDYVLAAAAEKLGLTDPLYDKGGVRIYTTLDLDAQKAAEEAVAGQLAGKGELQAALVAIDPRNGYVKAMVGGKDYAANQFNRAIAGFRQPGSSFKPIVYLTALQNGFTPVRQYKDEPTEFTYDNGKKVYKPGNFNNRYSYRLIDLREAIAKSDNVYAVHTVMDIGPDRVIETARKLGIASPLQPLPSLALGTFPVSPFEMASAFGVIANRGLRNEPVAVLRIEDADGRVLFRAKPAQQRAADAAEAYVLTTLMQSVFEEGGTGYRVSDLVKRPVAGKTGTTDTDAWMVGFTPELATAVWIGYDRGRAVSAAESYKAAPIFAAFTERALAAVPPKPFPVPEGVVSVYIDSATGKLANEACPNSRLEAFVKGTEPTEYCNGAAAGPAGDGSLKPADAGQSKSWWDDLKRWWKE